MGKIFKGKGFISILASVVSILAGLLVGFILLICFNSEYAVAGLGKIFTTGFASAEKFAKVLYQAAPLLMTGLSVGFAFKTGLFNIGASGQYTVGAFCALVCAIQFEMPWYVCLLAAMIGGAIWGFIPGICKALFNVNEVITSIMFNWIGLFLVNFLLCNMPKMIAAYWGGSVKDKTAPLAAANKDAIIPKAGLDEVFGSPYMNISIFIAIIFAIIMFIILNKTTFGYELKACGFNKNASIYAGINAKKNIVLSMVIAGALAGLGGGLYFLAGTAQYNIVKSLLSAGFDGIPIALLATSHPVGTIFSSLFISYIKVGGDALQPEFQKELIDIIISVIIYLSAFALLMKNVIGKILNAKKRREEEKAAMIAAATFEEDEKKAPVAEPAKVESAHEELITPEKAATTPAEVTNNKESEEEK